MLRAVKIGKTHHASKHTDMKQSSSSQNPEEKSARDYRFITFSVVAGYIALMLFSEFYFGTYTHILKYFVGSPAPYFIDTQVFLTGIEAVRQGLDPYTKEANRNLPLGFYNYPLSWTWLSFLPFLKFSNHIGIGLALLLALFISLYFFIGKISLIDSIAYSIIFTSSAFMLGVERGNNDLIIFLLLLIPIFKHGSQKILALAALAAGVLKLFPIAGLVGLAYHIKQSRKQTILLFLGTGILFLAYVFIMKENLMSVSRVTPRPFECLCYGLGTIPSYLQKRWNAPNIWVPYLLFLSAGLIAFYLIIRKQMGELKFYSDKFGLAHIIGSAVFTASCLIGYNWEYRLVFLVLTIPQTLKWLQAKKVLPAISLVLTILVMEQTFIGAQIEPRLPIKINYFLLSQFFAVVLFMYHASILINFGMQKIAQLRIASGQQTSR
jgi:hypothetical protein